MKKFRTLPSIFFMLSFFSASGLVIAEDKTTSDVDVSEEEMALLELLDEQTEIATKTKINADFVPGMVTILSGSELEKKGIHTVWQALGTVPGMEVSIDQTGSRVVKVRGIGGAFASGNLKILLNQVSMNSALTAQAQPVMNMPIEQIERIEVIRGPGSAVHGEHAYAGVVNVISKKNTKSVFAGVGGNKDRLVGGTYVWNEEDQNFNASLNMAFSKTDGEKTDNASDALFLTGAAINMSQAGVSNAPGSSVEDRKYKSVLFNFTMADYNLKVHWLEDDRSDFFGAINVLPDEDDDGNYENNFSTIDLSKKFSWSENLSADLQLGWLEYTNVFDFTLLPEGFGLWHYPSFPLTLNDGYLVDGYYKEDKYYVGTDVFWEVNEQHKLLFSLDYSQTEVKESWQKTNIDPNGTKTLADDFPINNMQKFHFEDGLNWPSEGKKRKLTSVTLQDEYQPIQPLLITAGLRYDDYSDVGDNVSPRIAAVYQLDDKHIFKGQYAEAFRPPTFYEDVWSPNLEPQTIDTVDLGYIYKGIDNILRLTIFYSELNDVIIATAPLGFKNSEGATVKGAEFELSHDFNSEFSTNYNLSYAESKDDLTGEAIPRTTNWLSNIDFRYKPSRRYDFSLRYHYVGKQYREVNDTREKLDDYGVIDVTANFIDLFGKNTSIQLGVDNLFDENIHYPSPMVTDILGSSFPSYEDDYPREERRWWLRLKYQFN
ncbi:MAG: TonB-dependent receptor [Gammaproteobacteria bacterium]|nr:TonB-dependent receptor [Gammaproteobacteria bacterium]